MPTKVLPGEVTVEIPPPVAVIVNSDTAPGKLNLSKIESA